MPHLGSTSASQDESPRIGYREPAPEPKPEPKPFPWDFVGHLTLIAAMFGLLLWLVFNAIFVVGPAQDEARKACEVTCDPYLVASSGRNGWCVCDVTRAHGKGIEKIP